MGLDMYLYADVYVSGWTHSDDSETSAFKRVTEAVGLDPFVTKRSPHGHVRVAVAYWRKANQIHRWFVEHVQGGVDDCNPHYVRWAQLDALVATSTDALAMIERGKDPSALLPPQSGFFFGSAAVDESYKEDLESTIAQIKALESLRDRVDDFFYRSSW